MKERVSKRERASKVLDSNPRTHKQMNIADVLQAYTDRMLDKKNTVQCANPTQIEGNLYFDRDLPGVRLVRSDRGYGWFRFPGGEERYSEDGIWWTDESMTIQSDISFYYTDAIDNYGGFSYYYIKEKCAGVVSIDYLRNILTDLKNVDDLDEGRLSSAIRGINANAVLPPITINGNSITDGNHRLNAAILAKFDYIPFKGIIYHSV